MRHWKEVALCNRPGFARTALAHATGFPWGQIGGRAGNIFVMRPAPCAALNHANNVLPEAMFEGWWHKE
eukprot:1137343-Pelagomonas_calceolata.AAC.5